MFLALVFAQTVVLGDFRVELTTAQDPTVRVFAKGEAIWEGVPKKHAPWKLAGGDIDGNGLPDFAVGVFKQTHVYPHPHHTVFFYEIRGGEVVPKWKGSSLGRTLLDFAYAEAGGKPALVALQRRLNATIGLHIWRWNGFGFRLEREEGAWDEATLGRVERDSVDIRTKSGSVWVKL